MALQTGTLIGATIRINDDQDLYPAAVQQEIKGGHHKRTSFTDLATFPAHLKEAGMLCFVAENSKTYQLANDLITWTIFSDGTPSEGGGTSDNTTTTTIINDNFGEWTTLPAQHAKIYDKQIDLQYKTDLSTFPSRSTVFVTGQFGLDATFLATAITIGKLPTAARPKARLKKWMACKGVELYLVIEINGDVKLQSKDGFNLPVATATAENDPYFIEIFFNPNIATVEPAEPVEPTVYSYTRTADFTRNNCGAGSTGNVVSFSKDYISNVSLADAQNIAMADTNYNALGQAHANANGTCQVLSNEDVQLGISGGYNPETNKLIFSAILSEALPFDLGVDFEYSFNDNGQPDGNSRTLTILAGQLSNGDYKMNYTAAGEITDFVVTITSIGPNPNGGKTIIF